MCRSKLQNLDYYIIIDSSFNINKTTWKSCVKKRKWVTGYQENRFAFLPAYNTPMRVAKKERYFTWFDFISHLICRSPRIHAEPAWQCCLTQCFDTEEGILHCLPQCLHSMPTTAALSSLYYLSISGIQYYISFRCTM